MNPNKKFKSSVFSFIFSNPEVLRELYCALGDVSLPPDVPVTINPNMALRLLMYIARVYEKIIEGGDKYSSKKIAIPRPEFFVLYNGTDYYPDEKVLKLSDLFEDSSSLGIPKERVHLELEVKVLNINEGRNAEIVKKCKTLAGYSAFIAKVRGFQEEGLTLGEALKKAIHYCLKHDILKEFLKSNGTEAPDKAQRCCVDGLLNTAYRTFKVNKIKKARRL